MLVEEPGEVAWAGRGDRRKALDGPVSRRLGANGVLRPVDGRMNVIASLKPWRKLRIRPGPAQIDDEIARYGKRHGMADFSGYDGEHEVDPSCHAGAGQPFTILDIESVISHPCSWSEADEFRKQGMMGGAFMAFKQASACGQ